MRKEIQLTKYGEEMGGYLQFLQDNSPQGDPDFREKLIRVIRQVTQQELTCRQQQFVKMYYFENQTIPTIAARLGINKSTVSRSLKGARKKMELCMKYLF